MSATVYGTDFEQIRNLLVYSPDADRDAAALLDAGFTPELVQEYFEAWSVVQDAEVSAAAFIRLDKRGVTPEILRDFAFRGFASANEIIRSWAAYAQLFKAGTSVAAIAAMAQADMEPPDTESVLPSWLGACLAGEPAARAELAQRIVASFERQSGHSFPARESDGPYKHIGHLAAYLTHAEEVSDEDLDKLVKWATRKTADQEYGWPQVHRAAQLLEEKDWDDLCDNYYRQDLPAWAISLHEKLPDLNSAGLAALARGLTTYKGALKDQPALLACTLQLLEQNPQLQLGGSYYKYSTEFVGGTATYPTPNLMVLGRSLSGHASLGRLDQVQELLDKQALDPQDRELSLLVAGLANEAPLEDMQKVYARFPELTDEQLILLAQGRVPDARGQEVKIILDRQGLQVATRDQHGAGPMCELADILPEAPMPALVALGFCTSKPQVAAELLELRPSLTLPQLFNLLQLVSYKEGLGGENYLDWLTGFIKANPELDNTSVLAAARAFRVGEACIGADEESRVRDLGWSSRRKLAKLAERETAEEQKTLEWIGTLFTALNWPADYLDKGFGMGHARAVFAGLSETAQGVVDACKDRYMQAQLDFDTYFDMPALMDRNFEYLDAFLIELVKFEDAARTGTVAEQEAQAQKVEAALTMAETKAREVGVKWLKGKAGYTEILGAEARLDHVRRLSEDPAATKEEKAQALATIEDIQEGLVAKLSTMLGGPAELQARLALSEGSRVTLPAAAKRAPTPTGKTLTP